MSVQQLDAVAGNIASSVDAILPVAAMKFDRKLKSWRFPPPGLDHHPAVSDGGPRMLYSPARGTGVLAGR